MQPTWCIFPKNWSMPFTNSSVSIDSLPTLEAADFEGLPSRYRTYRWMVYGCVLLMAGVGLGALVWFELEAVSTLRWGVWFAIALVGVFEATWALEEWKGFPLRGVLVREHDLSYRSGFLRQEVITVPFNRIQHSEISQGPLARMFNICTLKLYTAGSSGANLRVSGMDVERAQRLRQRLDERVRRA